jgi:triosephosphate isomerase
MKPLVVVNFKTYKEATGANALKLAKACSRFKNAIICVQAADLCLAKKVKIPVFAQHVDLVDYGQFTGFILPEDVKADGAKGTLLNHSEHRLKFDVLKKLVQRCRKIKLKTIVCAKTADEVRKVSKLKPDFVAIEPPELIGGKISVSTARPSLISDAVKKSIVPVLCGAGVHTGEDVKIAMKLGAKGVLVASGVVKAKNPAKVLKELAL